MKKLDLKQLYVILAFLLSAVVAFCGVQIWREYSSLQKDMEAFSELAKMAEIKEADAPKESAESETNGNAHIGDETNRLEQHEVSVPTPHHDIPFLISQNRDCIGWLSIQDTAVDYPVMHTPELPQKYLRLSFYQQDSRSGVPFLDHRCTLDSDNLIVYGHNMRNGTMFSPLTEYLEGQLSGQRTILLETEHGAQEFTVFAVAIVDQTDPWYSFIHAENQEDFHEAVQELIQRAEFASGEIPKYGVRLLTLSTCYDNGKARIIVVAAEAIPPVPFYPFCGIMN